MEHETKSYRRLPKGGRRVHFADSMGMDLASIFLIDFLNNYNHLHQIQQSILLKQQQENQRQQQHHYHHQKQKLQQYQKQQQQLKQQQLQQQQQQREIHLKQQSQLHSHQHSQQLSQYQQRGELNNNNKLPIVACQFTQPISLISFKERVRINKVHLETCQVDHTEAGLISVTCTIRVLNLAYDKSVIVRYTLDEWYTFTDCHAIYKEGSSDGWSDKFVCTFNLSDSDRRSRQVQRVMIAIQYIYGHDKNTCWDNNGGFNYTIQIQDTGRNTSSK